MANLITIDEYKNYKQINSEEYDTIISMLIGSVSDFIKEYTGRTLIDNSLSDKVEYFDATSYPEYLVEEFPLLSVTSLELSVDGGVTYATYTENTDFFVDGGNDRIISNTSTKDTKFISSSIPFRSGKITYKGGYNKTPSDLKLACMDLVEYYRTEEHVSRKSMAGASVDSSGNVKLGSNLPAHIKRVLDLYRIL